MAEKEPEMTQELETGGPAFPCEVRSGGVAPDANGINRYLTDPYEGMTIRAYAAIKLRVPRSGIDWLDDMIRESRRNDDARAVMQGFAADPNVCGTIDRVAANAYEWADAIQKARGE